MYCTNISCSNPEIEAVGIAHCPSCGEQLLLHQRYYATKLIGQGGFGRTYRAIDNHNPDGKLCVIKQFTFQSSNSSTNKTAIDLFYQEAEHLRSLGDHPQVPSLVDYFDEDGKSYLVQEFIDGDNLQQELSIEGRFNQGQIREVLESLLPVLDWLHHRSTPVIHRDIKPANIIRRRSDGKLVLVDFGAAKLASETLLAKTGTSIGSAEYAAPEQVRGKPTFASDIYSLGVTCIHLLTAIPPFDLYSVGENDWDWHNSLGNNRVDRGLGEAIDKMISPALSRRFRTALEALSALKNSQKIVNLKGQYGIRNLAPQEDRLLQEALSVLPPSSLPAMNTGGLMGVLVVGLFHGMLPFQQLIVKHFLVGMGDLSVVAISITYGSFITMLTARYFLKSRQFYEEGNFDEMWKSIATPWMLLVLIYAIDVLLASLFRY
jgi:serine/threonine protein kinase